MIKKREFLFSTLEQISFNITVRLASFIIVIDFVQNNFSMLLIFGTRCSLIAIIYLDKFGYSQMNQSYYILEYT